MVRLMKSFVALLSASTVALATVVKIEADLGTLNTTVINLNKLIVAYPNTGGTLANALTIHTTTVTLINQLTGTAGDVKATSGPLSVADGNAILTDVKMISPTIISALNAIVTKKPAFSALPVGGVPTLVHQDLVNLNTSAAAFSANFIAICPTSLVGQVTDMKNKISATLGAAIKVYAK